MFSQKCRFHRKICAFKILGIPFSLCQFQTIGCDLLAFFRLYFQCSTVRVHLCFCYSQSHKVSLPVSKITSFFQIFSLFILCATFDQWDFVSFPIRETVQVLLGTLAFPQQGNCPYFVKANLCAIDLCYQETGLSRFVPKFNLLNQ